jgi:hypothetical protein
MGDVVRYILHPGYCIVSAHVVNPNAAAYAAQNLVGQPVKASGANYVFVESTDEAAVIGLFAGLLGRAAGAGFRGFVRLLARTAAGRIGA